jgi:lysophospholipase L1-like esterase
VFAILMLAGWIGTWEAAPSSTDPHVSFVNSTVRDIVHVSIGGNRVRVRFTNRFGMAPLAIGAATVALERGNTASAKPGTMRVLTFSRSKSIMIPPAADVYSDGVSLRVSRESNLLVSIYLPEPTGSPTYHHLSYQINYEGTGNLAAQPAGTNFVPIGVSWYFVDSVDVAGSNARGAVVVLGDSITNGQGSTINGNNRWPDDLARRLLGLQPARRLGVLNAAIDGNRILLPSKRFGPDALARLDSDVLSQSGVRDLIVLLGINDIQERPHQYDARRIEAGLEQLVVQARARGLHVIGCTITPYEGWLTYSPRGEATRLVVNSFIRHSGIFDGAADFDAIVRDPRDPHRLLPRFDSGDHLHPNAAAYRLMANAIDFSKL